MTAIEGVVNDAFAGVREAFTENFEESSPDLGAACCVVVHGEVVVDLWGGWADRERRRRWTADTLCNAYSVGKPMVATMLLQQVDAGRVDLDAAASSRWPELIAGAAGATVRDVLCHRAGVPAVRERLTNDDLWSWSAMCEAIAATEPWWPPGTRHAYHTNTYGFLVGELARRASEIDPGAWLQSLDVGPGELFWGVPDEALGRCADVWWDAPSTPGNGVGSDEVWAALQGLHDEARMIQLGYVNPPGFSSIGVVNTRAWRQAQIPSTNLHATARGIAAFYGALLDGSLLAPATLVEATTTQSEGWCPVLEREVSFGLGFQPTRPDRPFGPNAGSYGHFGSGGALGFADPAAGVTFGYVMNAVRPRWQSTRNKRLVEAVYACL
jgi:CubicO group peptidase (beta-lactamase class C family)